MQTILLVEDAPATLIARSLILRCFGYTVLEANSRGEAWRANLLMNTEKAHCAIIVDCSW